MRMQDHGKGSRGASAESGIADSAEMQRMRWRCRRGLLELDIVLGRFIEQRYPLLDMQQRVVFDELLDLPDTELWDLVTVKKEPTHMHQRMVLEWLQQV